jgi:hypothetical protein
LTCSGPAPVSSRDVKHHRIATCSLTLSSSASSRTSARSRASGTTLTRTRTMTCATGRWRRSSRTFGPPLTAPVTPSRRCVCGLPTSAGSPWATPWILDRIAHRESASHGRPRQQDGSGRFPITSRLRSKGSKWRKSPWKCWSTTSTVPRARRP